MNSKVCVGLPGETWLLNSEMYGRSSEEEFIKQRSIDWGISINGILMIASWRNSRCTASRPSLPKPNCGGEMDPKRELSIFLYC
jgi:hypothetical protein